MNRITLIAASALAFTNPALSTTLDEACSSIAGAASAVMRSHQHGMPLQGVLDGVKKMPEQFRASARAIAIDAYSRPRYSSPQYQERAIAEFRDEVHVLCLTAK